MAKGMYVGVKSTLDPAQDSFKIVSSSKQDFVDRKIIVPGGVGGSKYWDTTNMTSSTFYPNEAVNFASSTIWPSSFNFSNKFFLFSNDLTHLYVITSVSNKTEIKTEISTYALDPGSSVEITASGSVYDIAESPSVARKVKKMYVGINTNFPTYSTETQNVSITASNISDYFTVLNGDYYFSGNRSIFTTNNAGINSSTASTTLMAKQDISSLTFNYSYSSEANYDLFTLKVGLTTVESGVSGATTTKTYTGSLPKGQSIVFTYSKDGSGRSNNDRCTFSEMAITMQVETQIGNEIKSVAYKVKKGYVGIGGVARPFFGEGIPMYYGRATDITVDRTCMSGVTMGSYALFVGGLRSVNYSDDTPSNSIDIYDNKLVHTTNTLSGSRYRMAGVGMTDWSLFAGGKTGADENTNCSATVYKIDNNFVKTVASTGLTTAVWAVAGSSVGDYALVAGGRTNTRSGVVSNVAAYNKSLTKTVVSSLTTANAFMAGCRLNDNLVIFGGGNKESKINSYNSSLTQGASSQTFYDNKNMGTAVLNGKAVYAGGYNNDGTGKPQVYLFDSSLTRSEVSTGLIKGRPAAGVTMDDYILFGGGYYGTTAGAWQCDIYDKSLTRTNPTEDLGRVGISSISYVPSGANVGNYALFTGDYYKWTRAFIQN